MFSWDKILSIKNLSISTDDTRINGLGMGTKRYLLDWKGQQCVHCNNFFIFPGPCLFASLISLVIIVLFEFKSQVLEYFLLERQYMYVSGKYCRIWTLFSGFMNAVKFILVSGYEPSLGWSSCSRQPKTSHSLACLAPNTCLALLGLVRIIVVVVVMVM